MKTIGFRKAASKPDDHLDYSIGNNLSPSTFLEAEPFWDFVDSVESRDDEVKHNLFLKRLTCIRKRCKALNDVDGYRVNRMFSWFNYYRMF